MSCRILSTDDHGLVKPLDWRVFGAAAVANTVPDKPAAAGAAAEIEAETDDSPMLHARILQLELSLASELKQARELGFADGLAAGHESASAEMKPALQRLLQSYGEVAGLRGRIRKETEADLVTLTIAVARRVLRRELTVDPDAIHGVVKAALSKIQTKDISVIRTHPDHVGPIRAFFAGEGLGAGVEIVADATLPIGSVVLETKRGNLDASVDTQLKEIERGFTDRLGR